jgi:hypothetical protein
VVDSGKWIIYEVRVKRTMCMALSHLNMIWVSIMRLILLHHERYIPVWPSYYTKSHNRSRVSTKIGPNFKFIYSNLSLNSCNIRHSYMTFYIRQTSLTYTSIALKPGGEWESPGQLSLYRLNTVWRSNPGEAIFSSSVQRDSGTQPVFQSVIFLR